MSEVGVEKPSQRRGPQFVILHQILLGRNQGSCCAHWEVSTNFLVIKHEGKGRFRRAVDGRIILKTYLQEV